MQLVQLASACPIASENTIYPTTHTHTHTLQLALDAALRINLHHIHHHPQLPSTSLTVCDALMHESQTVMVLLSRSQKMNISLKTMCSSFDNDIKLHLNRRRTCAVQHIAIHVIEQVADSFLLLK